MVKPLKNGVVKMLNADYEGMAPAKWPSILPKFEEAFTHAYIVCSRANWIARYERAVWHRNLHYSFGKEL